MGKLFNELMEGMQALELHLKGKITLKTTVVEVPDPIVITPEEVKAIRQKLNLSQAVFARKLHTSVRTYQGWEQGRTKPNPQAVLLLKMVEKSPQTFEQIASLYVNIGLLSASRTIFVISVEKRQYSTFQIL